jgi:hypothetical protein
MASKAPERKAADDGDARRLVAPEGGRAWLGLFKAPER